MEDIETNMKALRYGESVSYKPHIGGGYYVSITSGFYMYFVDIRKFSCPMHGETDVKPTRRGIALRLRKWEEMKKIIDAIDNAYPTLGTALPYYLWNDHLNQLMWALQCTECYPFSTVTCWRDILCTCVAYVYVFVCAYDIASESRH